MALVVDISALDDPQWMYSVTFASTLNVAFRSFEPRIGEPFPNEQLLRKKNIMDTEQTIFHWETAVQFTVQKI